MGELQGGEGEESGEFRNEEGGVRVREWEGVAGGGKTGEGRRYEKSGREILEGA